MSEDRPQLEQDCLDLAAYARKLQIALIAEEHGKHQIGTVLKNEWRALDEWHHGLSVPRMNWLNDQLRLARERLDNGDNLCNTEAKLDE